MAVRATASSTQPVVTIIPCGHTCNEDAVIQFLVKDKLCPLDNQRIEGYIPPSYQVQIGSPQLTQPAPVTTVQSMNQSAQKIAYSNIFGAAQWAQYIGDVGAEPPLPSNIQQLLESPCLNWEGQKIKDTHVLTLIPQTVNGKPLTLRSLKELVKTPKQGNATGCRRFEPSIFADVPAPASHWVLMSRDVIPESRRIHMKSWSDKREFIKKIFKKTNLEYKFPNMLDISVCIFMEYIQSGNLLYSSSPVTYALCYEKEGGSGFFSSAPPGGLIGGFDNTGLDIGTSMANLNGGAERIGAGVLVNLTMKT